MRGHDPAYICGLLEEWRQGDANAFAALYSVTYRKMYEHAYQRLMDIYLTQDAVTETYLVAGEEQKPEKVPLLRWLMEISDSVCDRILQYSGKAAEKQRLGSGKGAGKSKDAGESKGTGKKKGSGQKAASKVYETMGDGIWVNSAASADGEQAVPELDEETAEQMLYNILDTLGMEQNTVPLQNLNIYMGYRRQRSRLMTLVVWIMAAMIFFLPLLLIRPNMTLEKTSNADEAGRPVYTVRVNSIPEIYSVTATIGKDQMPVYQEGESVYTIRPTQDGIMQVTVTADNRRSVSESVLVDREDTEPPQLVKRSVDGKASVTLTLKDESGVDFPGISGVDSDGRTVKPLSVDEKAGEVTFAYPSEKITVSVPDRTGNVLRLILNP
ncbi:MAG: hypothetical protein SOT60_05390 [Bilifractor sp.]|nr:hypothetical protein [Lachnospiraceae bacterium]MDY2837351.1 hypothetical protein [Bilifractor sp.]